MQKRLYEISPEHAAKLNAWKNMQPLIYRVDPAVYAAMEDETAAHGIATPHHPTDLVAGSFLLDEDCKEPEGWTDR